MMLRCIVGHIQSVTIRGERRKGKVLSTVDGAPPGLAVVVGGAEATRRRGRHRTYGGASPAHLALAILLEYPARQRRFRNLAVMDEQYAVRWQTAVFSVAGLGVSHGARLCGVRRRPPVLRHAGGHRWRAGPVEVRHESGSLVERHLPRLTKEALLQEYGQRPEMEENGVARAIRTLQTATSPDLGTRIVPSSARMIGLRFTVAPMARASASAGGAPSGAVQQ